MVFGPWLRGGLLGGAISMSFSSVGHGQILADQSFEPGYISLGIFSDSQNNNQEAADGFTLVQSGQVKSADWWGYYFGAGDPLNAGDMVSFRLRFYPVSPSDVTSDDFSVTALVSETSSTNGGDQIYHFLAGLDGPNLDAGTPYFLSVQETSERLSFTWTPHSAGDMRWRNDVQGGWFIEQGNRGNLAFRLQAVPEPASSTPVGMLVAGILASAIRRTRSARRRGHRGGVPSEAGRTPR